MKELRDALEAIEPAVRQALELAYFRGLDIHAIAEIVDTPAHELRPLLREALLSLGAATRDSAPRQVQERVPRWR